MSDKWTFELGESNMSPCPDDCFGAIIHDGYIITEIKSDIRDPQNQADHIVRALNSYNKTHDELLEMLKAWIVWFRQGAKAPLYRTELAIKNAEEK